jgi:hypothetical protein
LSHLLAGSLSISLFSSLHNYMFSFDEYCISPVSVDFPNKVADDREMSEVRDRVAVVRSRERVVLNVMKISMVAFVKFVNQSFLFREFRAFVESLFG